MPGVVFLRGEQVTLRTIEQEDAAIIQRAYNEPDFQQGFLIESPKSRSAIEERIQEGIEQDEDSIYLMMCVDETPVGSVSLKDMRRSHGMLAYWLLPDKRGHGYVTEGAALLLEHAFDTIGLHRVFAWTIDDNEASQAVLRRLGFTHEGTYREHVFSRGAYHDTEHYGLLASEWTGAKPVLDNDN
jgi:RimJ/RimL family protein N-acetyltransferase